MYLMKRLVVLGSNFAGLNTALLLRKSLPDEEIIVIDKNRYFEYYPSMYKIISKPEYEADIKFDLETIYTKRKIKFINDEIISIDAKNNKVKTKNDEHNYDYLVNCLGSVTNFYNITGAKDNSLTFKSFNDIKKIREKLVELSKKENKSNIVVVGSGLAGIELVFEIRKFLNKNNLMQKISLTIVESKKDVCSWTNQKVIVYIEKKLKDAGINLKTDFMITNVEPNNISDKSGQKLDYDLLVWCAGVCTNQVIKDSGIESDSNGILVDEYLRNPSYKNIYSCGDSVSFKINDCFIQKNGHHALTTSNLVVDNISAEIKSSPLKAFKSSNKIPSLIDLNEYGVLLFYKSSIYIWPGFFYGLLKKFIQVYWIFTRKNMM